jgi:hypothetical protein
VVANGLEWAVAAVHAAFDLIAFDPFAFVVAALFVVRILPVGLEAAVGPSSFAAAAAVVAAAAALESFLFVFF